VKIAIVHNRYQQRGGEDQVVDAEAALLRAHGHEVIEWLEDNRGIAQVPTWQVAVDTFWSRSAARRVERLCREHRPDVVHCHNTFPRLSPSVQWAAHHAGVPVVQTLHNFRLLCVNAVLLRDGRPCVACVGHLPWRGVLHRCYRHSAWQSAATAGMLTLHRALGTAERAVDCHIALTEHARRLLVEGGLPADRIVVKPNFAPDPGPADDRPRQGLLYVGRLSPEKGLDVLLQAAALAGQRVTVVGDGPLAEACRSSAWIDFRGPGTADQVRDAMRGARALLLPSTCHESMPRVLVEAFACGLPVVASRLGALAELVDHDGNGLLFEAGDPQALADAMGVAVRGDRLAQWSGHARAAYDSRYTEAAALDALLRVYRRVIAERATREG
jgi:glycosyltransferase involved in cell wall biosynthesis